MLAHYLMYLKKVVESIFLFFAIISASPRWMKCNNFAHGVTLQKVLSSYFHLQILVLCWAATRYYCHYAFALFIFSIMDSIDHLIYFYNILWPGKIVTKLISLNNKSFNITKLPKRDY